MADEIYIPGLPQNLQGVLYTPNHSLAETKRLRERHAGDPTMQQRLMVDDRYWQGREMTREAPLAAGAAFAGSIPYDLAKLAYFNSPRAVQKPIEKVTEALFPGEGFNQQTTARPSRRGTGAYLHGAAEGAYGLMRDKINELASHRIPESVADRLSQLTHGINTNSQSPLARAIMPSEAEADAVHDTVREDGKKVLKQLGSRVVLANAVDPIGASLRTLNTILQTVAPDVDTRPAFNSWSEPGYQAVAPGLKPVRTMTPERKAAQNAQISQILGSWGTAKPVEFPRGMQVRVPK